MEGGDSVAELVRHATQRQAGARDHTGRVAASAATRLSVSAARHQRLSPLSRGRARGDRPAVPGHQPRRDGVRVRRHAPPHHRGPARRRARHPRRAVRPLRDHRGARTRRGRSRRRRQRRRDREPAPHRAPLRHARHPRVADVRRVADERHQHPPAGLLHVAPARLRRRPAARGRADGRGRAHLPDRARALALLRRDPHDQARDPGAPGPAGLRRRAERWPWQRLVPAGPQPAAGAGGDRAGQARRRGRRRVLRPLRLLGARRMRSRRRRPRADEDAPPRGQHPVHRPLGRQRLRRVRARGRHEGRLHQHLQPGRDRPLLQHRPLPRPEPGRGGEHDRAGRDPDPGPVLPGGGRHPADAGVPRGQAVQHQGADQARRLPRPADDRRRNADRGRPHERARPRPGARRSLPSTTTRSSPGTRAPAGRGPRRSSAPSIATAAWDRRRPTPPRTSPASCWASGPTAARGTTSGSAWAPTPAASPPCPARPTMRRRTRWRIPSSRTTAG